MVAVADDLLSAGSQLSALALSASVTAVLIALSLAETESLRTRLRGGARS
jgi:hypothetical protein